MLVLWAASKEYSAVSAPSLTTQLQSFIHPTPNAELVVSLYLLQEIEAVLKHWASTFDISDTELNDRIMAAANGQLTRPCSASANVRTCFLVSWFATVLVDSARCTATANTNI